MTIYCGNATKREGKFWEFITASVKLAELEKYTNEKWYCNIVISEMKAKDKFWNTHSVSINEFKPKKETELTVDDLPF
jgi:hypothetical protein